MFEAVTERSTELVSMFQSTKTAGFCLSGSGLAMFGICEEECFAKQAVEELSRKQIKSHLLKPVS